MGAHGMSVAAPEINEQLWHIIFLFYSTTIQRNLF